MKQNLLIVLFVLSLSSTAFSQGRTELLRLGDAAFKNENYPSAAYFYNKIVTGSSSGIISTVYPYDLKNYTKPQKQEKSSSETPIDTLGKEAPVDSASALLISKANTQSELPTLSSDEEAMLEIIYKLAESYRLSYDYTNAEKWYGKIYESKSSKFPVAPYWYGNALLKNSSYEKSMKVLSEYLKTQTDKESEFYRLATLDFRNCLFAIKANLNINKGVNIKKVETLLNNGGSNFAAAFWEEKNVVVFTSSRTAKKSVEADDEKEKGPVCDLYYVTVENGPTYSDLKRVELPSNQNHQGTAVFSPDKTKMYYTQWTNDKEKPECAIYVSKFLFNQWLQPRKLGEQVNVPGYKTMQPSLSEDGTTLYFASDRPKGAGKMDLWSCTVDEFDNISSVKNLGRKVNSSENEVSPFYHAETQTLYFSSDGRSGMGGLDIYKISSLKDFTTDIENLGAPFNSSRDDAYFVLDKNQKEGYLSTDKESCANCDGGNCYSIYHFTNSDEPVTITVSGTVYDSETNKVLANTLIYLNDVDNLLEPIFVLTDDNGFYSAPLPKDKQFYATAQKVKYFKDDAKISTKGIKSPAKIAHDFHLKPIPSGDIAIEGIEYDYDKATLRPVSKTILDKIVAFLKLNDEIIVEISSHTDVRGNDDYNMALSQARAKSVVEYLIEKGIADDRLKPTGYGETKLLVKDATTEIQHQKNRRTAFRILSEGYIAGEKRKYIPPDAIPAAGDSLSVIKESSNSVIPALNGQENLNPGQTTSGSDKVKNENVTSQQTTGPDKVSSVDQKNENTNAGNTSNTKSSNTNIEKQGENNNESVVSNTVNNTKVYSADPVKTASAIKPLPAEFKSADKNGDGVISAMEISSSIDDFFEQNSKITVEQVYKLIDYFFEQ